VGASDSNDRLADFSNYGSSTVDLYAPGVDVISTYAAKPFSRYDGCSGDAYCALSGTSMAAPHAAAAAALVASVRPDLRGSALRDALVGSAEVKSSLGAPGRRRLNAARALEAVVDSGADAVDNRSDNCPVVASGAQPEADGSGDGCDATPAPSTSGGRTPTPAPQSA
jgi:subtilisin family serine protease